MFVLVTALCFQVENVRPSSDRYPYDTSKSSERNNNNLLQLPIVATNRQQQLLDKGHTNLKGIEEDISSEVGADADCNTLLSTSDKGHQQVGLAESNHDARATDHLKLSSAKIQVCAVCNNNNWRQNEDNQNCSCNGPKNKERNFFDWVSRTRDFSATQLPNKETVDTVEKPITNSSMTSLSDDEMTCSYRSYSPSLAGTEKYQDITDDEEENVKTPDSNDSYDKTKLNCFENVGEEKDREPKEEVVVTRVTCNCVTVTFFESPTKSGFFNI